jgi:hypothetical protein
MLKCRLTLIFKVDFSLTTRWTTQNGDVAQVFNEALIGRRSPLPTFPGSLCEKSVDRFALKICLNFVDAETNCIANFCPVTTI